MKKILISMTLTLCSALADKLIGTWEISPEYLFHEGIMIIPEVAHPEKINISKVGGDYQITCVFARSSGDLIEIERYMIISEGNELIFLLGEPSPNHPQFTAIQRLKLMKDGKIKGITQAESKVIEWKGIKSE